MHGDVKPQQSTAVSAVSSSVGVVVQEEEGLTMAFLPISIDPIKDTHKCKETNPKCTATVKPETEIPMASRVILPPTIACIDKNLRLGRTLGGFGEVKFSQRPEVVRLLRR